jgi:predicted RND superfamily exporter protein
VARLYRFLLLRGWWLVVALLLGAAAFLGSKIGGLNIDAGTNVLLNEDDPDLAYYNLTRPDWGYDEYAIVCVTRDDWFTPEGVAALQALAEELRRAPHVASVASILDVPLLRNNPFFPAPTSLGAAGCHLGRAKMELLEHTMARGNLVSPDGRSLAVLAYLDIPPETRRIDPLWSRLRGERWTRPEAAAEIEALRPEAEAANAELKRRRFEMMRGVRTVAAEWTSKLAEPVRLAGVPVINLNLVEHVRFDLEAFGLASLALFTLAFFAVYRRARWVALPILTCLLPPTLIVGWMAWTGMKMSVITSNLPVLLFVFLLPYTVYWIERYRERRAASPDEDAVESTLGAARAVWVPCLFSCLTTMAGVASLMTSGIVPVHTFGRMMTIGMAVGLACVFLFLPAASIPLAGLAVASAGPSRGARGLVRLFEAATLRAPWAVVAASAVVLGVSAWGATRLDAETKFTDYFRRGSEIYEGLEIIDTRMGGTTSVEILLRSDEPGFFRTDAGLAALAAAARYFDGVPETGNVRSFKLLVDEVRKSFPKLRIEAVTEQLRRLAPDLVREFANEDFSVSRIFVRMRETAPTLHRNRILAGLREHLAAQPELRGLAEVRPTGVFLLYANMLNSLIESQRDTFAMVVAAIFAMLLILFRSPILAAIVLLPQVLPAVAVLGAMGWLGVPLDLVTVMIASIAMGVGIDAAIQYAMRYRAELAAAGGDRRAAVSRAHATIGRAIWIATSAIVAGFCVLVLSRFVPSVYFGLFTALAMLMGQFAALTTLPALFLVTGRPR